MEKNMNNKKKFPLFWVIYAGVTVVSLLVVGLLLNKLYSFLDAYEATRPVHEADKTIASVFLPENRETLKKLLTNKVENGIETEDDLLNLFYSTIENKELSQGRFFGKYSDTKPQYIVSAGKEQVANFALKETVKYDKGFDFKLWEVESVTLTIQPKYSYAVTIPDTMTLYINGKEIDKTAATGHKDSDCKVGYSEYSGSGFYYDPKIKVVDRTGHEVTLMRDEATGAYYYLLHYAYAPVDTVVSFGGTVLTEKEAMVSGIDSGVDFFMIKETIKKYTEYKCLEGKIDYPTFVKYYVDLYVEEEGNTWTNRLGTESEVIYDSESRTFSAGLVSDETEKEEMIAYITEFLKDYAYYCTGDKKITAIKPYFPENSEYYEKISHLNTFWVRAHTNTSIQNVETKEYFGYTDNLIYVHVYMEQKMKVKINGEWAVVVVDIPVWAVKIDDKWYVGAMDYDFNADEIVTQ